MSALSQKETRALVKHLREQGADVKRTKKGIMVLFPNGASTTIHYTNSDHRSTRNQRAEILRAGLTWPFDHQRRENEEPIMAAPGLSPEKRATLDRAIAEAGHGPTGIAAIRKLTGLSDPTVKLAMKAAGFEQENRTTWVRPNLPDGWTEPEHPTLAEIAEAKATETREADQARAADAKIATKTAKNMTIEEQAAKAEAARVLKNQRQNAARAEKMAAARGLVLPKVVEAKEPGYPETYREIELAKIAAEKRAAAEAQRLLDEADAAAEAAAEAELAEAKADFDAAAEDAVDAMRAAAATIEKATTRPAATAAEREFIDTMDSWTIGVPKKLQDMAKSMGLHIEVRVWRQQ